MKLVRRLNLRLTAVHLVDAHLCRDPAKVERYGKLAFNLDFYTDVKYLSYLQYHIDQDPCSAKYRTKSVGNLVKQIDKCNRYIFAGIEESAVTFSKIAVTPTDWDYYRVAAVQEKYMKDEVVIDDD